MKKEKKNKNNLDKVIKLKVRIIGSKILQKGRITKKKIEKNVEAPPEQYFWLRDGSVLKNLRDLQKVLETMSEEQYVYHTQDHGNDFSAWIGGVFKNDDLAQEISQAKDKKIAIKTLKKYLA